MTKKKRNFVKQPVDAWAGESILPGQTKNVELTISESYSGMQVRIPIQVRRAAQPGPTVFVTAALHGDEINGTGAIRHLLHAGDLELTHGCLILVPVLNLLAFERHSRYLPDRRDLNRFFPGSPDGSLASRMAHNVFQEIVLRSDYGIDLHTAAVRRTNYPNVRGHMADPEVARLAKAFGCEIILNSKGPIGSFRREASAAGCPTIIVEGGEVWKVETRIVTMIIQGIKNVLSELGMCHYEQRKPVHQVLLHKTKWLRAERGGFLQFHVKPGEVVEAGQPIATNTNLLGVERSTLVAPFSCIIIGMTTLPAVTPGEPVCHIGLLPDSMPPKEMSLHRAGTDGTEDRMISDLSTSVMIVSRTEGQTDGLADELSEG